MKNKVAKKMYNTKLTEEHFYYHDAIVDMLSYDIIDKSQRLIKNRTLPSYKNR